VESRSTGTTTGLTITAQGDNVTGVRVLGTSCVTLQDTVIRSHGTGLDLATSSTATMNGGTITTGTARNAGARPVTGAYNSDAQGFSLEFGRRIGRASGSGNGGSGAGGSGADSGAGNAAAGWWIEPTVQAAVVWLHGASYRTSPGNQSLDVKVDTARAAQYRAQLRFGRQLRDTRWRPYGKFGVVKTDTAGGEIRITGAGEPFAPDYDGWRGEFGLGASYLLDARSQLYFDYEYGKAAHYERPWSLNLGYRVLW
jgi:outer membrane autotransporter protein